MSKRIKAMGGSSKKKDKALSAPSHAPPLEKDLFQTLSKYANYLQMIPRKVEPIKCLHEKLLIFTHLTPFPREI